MCRPTTIDALLRRERNENVHTDHVTRLALQLFDAAAPHLGLDAGGRRLLEAAARIHDVGFAGAPGKHTDRGAALVLKTPLRGFDPHDRQKIAGIVRLHSGDLRGQLKRHSALRNGPDALRIRQLGAILRVADALDHGHVQDAEILRVRRTCGAIVLRMRSPAFPGNRDAARRKSDLWNEVFALPLRIVSAAVPAPVPPLHRGDTLTGALRKLLFLDYRVLTALARDADARAPAHGDIHAARIALRRSAALMRIFAGELAGTGAATLARRLRRLSRRLNEARDATVWRARLESPRVRRAMRDVPGWTAYIARERTRERRTGEALRDVWLRPEWHAARQAFAVLLRVELPRLPASTAAADAAGRPVRKACRRLPRQCTRALLRDPGALHRMRRRMRRARYVAERFAPLLPHRLRRDAADLHRLEVRLGKLHDLDLAIARLARDAHPVAAQLAAVLSRRRRKHASRFGDRG